MVAVSLIVALYGCIRPTPAPDVEPRPVAVWLDVDLSAGIEGRDVDDAIALLFALRSPEVRVVGVSTVFGNAPLDDVDPRTRDLVARFGPPGLRVHTGAANPGDVDTDAVSALADALGRERLVVLAVGPATNVAAVARAHPDRLDAVDAIVAVAGRRPGQRFVTGTTSPKGHRDLNFESDPDAFRALLATDVPLVLAPWELSSQVWLGDAHLDRWAAGGPETAYLADVSRPWLDLWRRTYGVEGFNPFDALAVGAVVWPDRIGCAALDASVVVGTNDVLPPDQLGDRPREKPYLHVGPAGSGGRPVRYCHDVDAAFADDLVRRLTDQG